MNPASSAYSIYNVYLLNNSQLKTKITIGLKMIEQREGAG